MSPDNILIVIATLVGFGLLLWVLVREGKNDLPMEDFK